MAKQVMQFRYYDKNNINNNPSYIDKESLVSGSIFENGYLPIIQLGVQSLPGTEFQLNNSPNSSVIIGTTGIYELDLEGYAEITGLKFARESLNLIEANPNAYLIVDIISDLREVE